MGQTDGTGDQVVELKYSRIERTEMTIPRWTQEEAIAYECARDCITDLIGIYSAEIAEEQRSPLPDLVRINLLEEKIASLAQECATLSLAEGERVRRIRDECGRLIRSKLRPA